MLIARDRTLTLTHPVELNVAPSVADNPPHSIALERVYEGSSIVHHMPLANDMVNVGVEEVRDADARIPIPTEKVQLVGQALNTFVAWPKNLVKPFLEHVFPFCFLYYY